MLIFGVLGEFLSKHKGLTLASFAFMALSPVNDVLVPHLYSKLIDSIQDFKSRAFVYNLVLVVVVLVGVQLGNFVLDLLNARFLPTLEFFLRSRLIDRVFQKYENHHKDLETGQLIAQLEHAPHSIIAWFSSVKDYLIPYLIMIVAAAVYFLRQDAMLGLNFIALTACIIILFIESPIRCRSLTTAVNALSHAVTESTEDVFRNILSVFDANQQSRELELLGGRQKLYQDKLMEAMVCILKSKAIAIPALVVFLCVFVSRCRCLIKEGLMKTSMFVSLFMIVTNMLTNMTWVIDIIRNASLDYGLFMGLEAALGDRAIAAPRGPVSYSFPPPYADGIGLVGVTFGFPNTKRPILDKVTVHFAPGEKTVLVGEVGSGKSTILKILFRFLRPLEGDAYFAGRWYASGILVEALRKHVAYFPQVPSLFNRPIIENVLYGNSEVSEADAIAFMERYDVLSEFENLEQGVRAPAGKNGSSISGGQRQLVWTIRSILHAPRVLLFDEPTSSMDASSKAKFNRILEDYLETHPRSIVVMVTHDPYLMSMATRSVRMDSIAKQ